jgi:C-terminal processing protease CtpA/Prc
VLRPETVRSFRRGPATGLAVGLGLLAVHPERIVVQVYSGGSASRAGIAVGDTIDEVNDSPPQPVGRGPLLDLAQHAAARLTVRRGQGPPVAVALEPSTYEVRQPPWGRRLDGARYLCIPPAAKAIAAEYLLAAGQAIRDLDDPPSSRWIVDVRLNVGGDVHLMLAAPGPILGEGLVGGLADARGGRRQWCCAGGRVSVGRQSLARDPQGLKRGPPRVAVLTSRLTASAGEAVVVALSGRPQTRRFGEPTAGVPTGLEDKRLRGGILVRCSTSLFVDRLGRSWSGPLAPDEPVVADWTRLGSADDPVVRAAIEWLGTIEDA